MKNRSTVLPKSVTIPTASVADPDPDPPDPLAFGPPGSGSGSISHKGIDTDPSIIKQKLKEKP
jgi:hypothetical protein